VFPLESQGQLAGFVVDEAHCVRYALFFLCTIPIILFINAYNVVSILKPIGIECNCPIDIYLTPIIEADDM